MKVLISGGSGLVGRAISKQLTAAGDQVAILSRSAKSFHPQVEAYRWDPEKNYIEDKALNGVDAIVNLAGANIAQRWTPHAKNEILRSRVDATRLIVDKLMEVEHQVKVFLSASAVGYYPNSLDQEFSEEDAPGHDFLSMVCQKWEQEAMRAEKIAAIRTVRMRIGIVLDAEDGALAKMAQPVKLGLGAPLGKGQQWMPWIHRDDLAAMFIFVLKNERVETGVYNAVGPSNCTNSELTKALAKQLNRPLILPKVPAFALKLVLGEMAATALASTKCSSAKILKLGFNYQYQTIEGALSALYPN